MADRAYNAIFILTFISTMRFNKFSVISCLLLPISSFAAGLEGFYVGGGIGYTQAEDTGKEHSANGSLGSWHQKTNPQGSVVGITAGYKHIVASKFVLGLEADYTSMAGVGDKKYQYSNNTPYSGYQIETEIRSAGSLLAKFGIVINPELNLYVGAGYGVISGSRTYKNDYSSQSSSNSFRQDGWIGAVGAEYQVAKSLSAGIEYRYADYGTKTDRNTALYTSGYEKQTLKSETIRLSVNYYF